ncbi:MAG: STAS domain-containing protein [Proteobacteria bacterium]|nr:STAS domain-containing protein [Burkholderiales bacterium]
MIAEGGLTGADGLFRVEGALTIERVPEVLEASVTRLAASAERELVIDLGGLDDFDSAALGAMLEWQRRVGATGGHITFTRLPPKLETLARLYGVSDLLTTASSA